MKDYVFGGLAAFVFIGACLGIASASVDVVSVVDREHSAMGIGPGFIDNLEDQDCPDAGALIQSEGSALSISCECDQDTLFGHETVLPLTGRAETNFDGNVRSIRCRSQSNSVCDCWALVTQAP